MEGSEKRARAPNRRDSGNFLLAAWSIAALGGLWGSVGGSGQARIPSYRDLPVAYVEHQSTINTQVLARR